MLAMFGGIAIIETLVGGDANAAAVNYDNYIANRSTLLLR